MSTTSFDNTRVITTAIASHRYSFTEGEIVTFPDMSPPKIVTENSEPFRGGALPHEHRKITRAIWDHANKPLPAEPAGDAPVWWTLGDIRTHLGVDPNDDAVIASGFPTHSAHRGGRTDFDSHGHGRTSPVERLWAEPACRRWFERTKGLRAKVAK